MHSKFNYFQNCTQNRIIVKISFKFVSCQNCTQNGITVNTFFQNQNYKNRSLLKLEPNSNLCGNCTQKRAIVETAPKMESLSKLHSKWNHCLKCTYNRKKLHIVQGRSSSLRKKLNCFQYSIQNLKNSKFFKVLVSYVKM